jgi:hypothetical protein
MKKIDLKKDLKAFYRPSAKKVSLIEVPEFKFIMTDGVIEKGMEPGTSPRYHEDLQAMYGAAYTLKFMIKKREENPIDYPVMALEGLWDVVDGVFDINVKDNWMYTSMILVPDVVTQDDFDEAILLLKNKKGDLPEFDRLRLDTYHEGLCVQTMHIGPYATEPETIAKMKNFMEENDLRDLVGEGGLHHEIYIGDPRRAAPEKLKTVLRHPVAR